MGLQDDVLDRARQVRQGREVHLPLSRRQMVVVIVDDIVQVHSPEDRPTVRLSGSLEVGGGQPAVPVADAVMPGVEPSLDGGALEGLGELRHFLLVRKALVVRQVFEGEDDAVLFEDGDEPVEFGLEDLEVAKPALPARRPGLGEQLRIAPVGEVALRVLQRLTKRGRREAAVEERRERHASRVQDDRARAHLGREGDVPRHVEAGECARILVEAGERIELGIALGRGDRDGTEGVDAADADPVQPRLEAGHLRLGRMEAELELVEAESERRVGDFLAGL